MDTLLLLKEQRQELGRAEHPALVTVASPPLLQGLPRMQSQLVTPLGPISSAGAYLRVHGLLHPLLGAHSSSDACRVINLHIPVSAYKSLTCVYALKDINYLYQLREKVHMH